MRTSYHKATFFSIEEAISNMKTPIPMATFGDAVINTFFCKIVFLPPARHGIICYSRGRRNEPAALFDTDGDTRHFAYGVIRWRPGPEKALTDRTPADKRVDNFFQNKQMIMRGLSFFRISFSTRFPLDGGGFFLESRCSQ